LHQNFRLEFIASGIDVNARNQAGFTPGGRRSHSGAVSVRRQAEGSRRLSKNLPELFDSTVRTCFESVKAARQGDRYLVGCGRYIFYFGLVGQHYGLIKFAADPAAAP
jgi:hypothetical protein